MRKHLVTLPFNTVYSDKCDPASTEYVQSCKSIGVNKKDPMVPNPRPNLNLWLNF